MPQQTNVPNARGQTLVYVVQAALDGTDTARRNHSKSLQQPVHREEQDEQEDVGITSIAMHPSSISAFRTAERAISRLSPKREPGRSSRFMSITQTSTSSSPARYVLHSVTEMQLVPSKIFFWNTLLLKSHLRARSRCHCAVALQWVGLEPTALALGVHYSVF